MDKSSSVDSMSGESPAQSDDETPLASTNNDADDSRSSDITSGTPRRHQRRMPLSGHHRVSGFNRSWANKYTWLKYVEGKRMFCTLSQKHGKHAISKTGALR